MAEHADVSSIDALEAFRADLIRYMEKARVALEDAESEVRRTRDWLDVDRTQHWTREMKRRCKRLENAEAELYNAKLTRPTETHAFYKMAVLKARREVEEAEASIRVLRTWKHQFDHRATPLVRRLDPAFFLVGQHLPKAVRLLGEHIKALQAYAEKAGGPKAMRPELPEESVEGGTA